MKLFEKNVGTIDRSIRLGAGLGLMIGGLKYLAEPLSYVVALVGLVVLLTGFFSTCGLYSLLGINTLGKKKQGIPAATKKRRRK